jgi:hypothetical protein
MGTATGFFKSAVFVSVVKQAFPLSPLITQITVVSLVSCFSVSCNWNKIISRLTNEKRPPYSGGRGLLTERSAVNY